MDIDFGAYRYGVPYTAYLEHLLRCTECGPTRCPTGADLCARYLAASRRPRQQRGEALR
ncbi:hypothetical protein ACWEWK_03130 [Streptomyces sp. NPDC003757]